MIEVKTDYEDVLVFTHKDNDGILAAFVIKEKYDNNLFNDVWPRNVEVKTCSYSPEYELSWFKTETNKFAAKVRSENKDAKIKVFMTDYAIQPNQDMIKFSNYVNEIGAEFIWCDHHITAIENLKHLKINGLQNASEAGCLNTWRFLNGSDDPPPLVKIVNDFDIWSIEQTKFNWEKQVIPFSFLMQSYGININDNTGALVKHLKEFYENPDKMLHDIAVIGVPMYELVKNNAKMTSSKVYEGEFFSLKCLAINSLGNNTYEFVNHEKYDEADVLVRWNYDGKQFNYDLYTCKDEIDIGELCAKYLNGGGHRKSGGGTNKKLLVKEI